VRGFKVVSLAVAYLLLVVAVFMSEALLTTAYLSVIHRLTSNLPEVVEVVGSGLVYGSYLTGPTYYKVWDEERRIDYYIHTNALYITLVNPNPMPTEVVVIGHIPGFSGTEKVVDILSALGMKFINKSEGVEMVVGAVRWFPKAYTRLYMPPHTFATFLVPTYSMAGYGGPTDILACTKVGCSKLEQVGEMDLRPYAEYQWVITKAEIPPKWHAYVAIPVQWEWRAETIGGPAVNCMYAYPILPRMTAILQNAVVCCSSCPPGFNPSSYGSERGVCSSDYGSVASYSVVNALPPNVIAGYYVTDAGFSFITPDTVRIGPRTYRLYGLRAGGSRMTTPDLIPPKWREYTEISCKDRMVTIQIPIQPMVNNEKARFSDVWSGSSEIYVYVGVKGYWSVPEERDTVEVSVEYVMGGVRKPVNSIKVSDYTYVDNSATLASNPRSWSIPINANEIIITIKYRMQGPRGLLELPCFSWPFFYCGMGSGGRRNVRFAFYIEIIPSEFLT